MELPDAAALLAECRRAFGSPPRRFAPWARFTYLRPPRPAWLTGEDQLSRQVGEWPRMLREGLVVWGWLCRPLLPLVVAPARPRPAAVLPWRYWPAGLVEYWREADW